jgi:uncharacterized membrane protein
VPHNDANFGIGTLAGLDIGKIVVNEFDRNAGRLPAPEASNVVPVSDKSAAFHSGAIGRLRNYFLTGLILVGPAYITISLTWWFINWVDDLVRPFIPLAYRPETYLPMKIPGLGLIIALVALTLLGFLTANFVGRKLVEIGENILNRMPVVRPVYKSLKQIFETLFSKGGSSFRRVGLVEFPSPGMWSLVFLSNSASPDIATRLPDTEHVAAFMPCTPNPTTGFFFYVPRRDIIDLDITVEAAMTLLMSAGMVQPDDQQKRLAALAETARLAHAARVDRPTAPAN